MKKLIEFAVAGTLTFALAPQALAADIKEMPAGLWQITSKMDVPGMPPEMVANMAQGMTVKQCIKPGERKWNDQRGPMQRGERKCDSVESSVSGNKISWKLKCADGTKGEGSVTHNGKDAFSSTMTMSGAQGSMKIVSEGKKIAETCDKLQK